jgi:hypothetical protein
MVGIVGVAIGDGGEAVDGEALVPDEVVAVAGVAVLVGARVERDSPLGSWHAAWRTTP